MREFIAVFQISKRVIFNVNYYTLMNNTRAHFTTSADRFNQNKSDFDICGQAQSEVLPKGSPARRFWEKWDALHLRELSPVQYDEMLKDLTRLKFFYNFLYKELDEKQRPYNPRFPFWVLVDFSKQTPRNSGAADLPTNAERSPLAEEWARYGYTWREHAAERPRAVGSYSAIFEYRDADTFPTLILKNSRRFFTIAPAELLELLGPHWVALRHWMLFTGLNEEQPRRRLFPLLETFPTSRKKELEAFLDLFREQFRRDANMRALFEHAKENREGHAWQQ